MQSNDYLSHYQNKKGIKACENMGRLSDNLFYAQEKSHKHWLLSLDNLGLRTARRGRIHNLGFRTARRGRIHNLGFRTARRGRIHNPGLRTAPCVPKRTVPADHKTWGQTQKDRPRVSKDRPRVSCGQPAGDGYITWGFGQPAGDEYKRNIPVCPQKDRPRRPQNMGTDTKGPSPCVLLLSLSLLSC